MRIAICDDEQNYRNLITKYIDKSNKENSYAYQIDLDNLK